MADSSSDAVTDGGVAEYGTPAPSGRVAPPGAPPPVPGPVDLELPTGLRVELDRHTIELDTGVLLGGSPPRMLHLAGPARALLAVDGRVTVADRTSARLVRRLLDIGVAHPIAVPPGAAPEPDDVTVVIPVRDRTDGLDRLLATLATQADGFGETVVVDDGSADPAAVATVATRYGARVWRHPVPRGPAAARNRGLAAAGTALVAFLDSDTVPQPGWSAPLRTAFADPAVALAAPRIVGLGAPEGWLGRYESVRSSLDLGPDPALVVPCSRVAYVPSAALLVRRTAIGAGFDERMQVAEDVDLVLRLHAAGWRSRYEPTATVAHEHRTAPAAWWLRRAYYGTGAAPLSARHPGSVPPLVLSPWAALAAALALTGSPAAAVAAGGVAVVAAERLARRLALVGRPRRAAARLVALGLLGAAGQASAAVTRHYWPLAAMACLFSRRARRVVLTVAVGEGLLDRWRVRGAAHPPGVLWHVLARRLDDLAYGSGLWWGAWRHRSLAALRPSITTDGRRRRTGPSEGTGPNR